MERLSFIDQLVHKISTSGLPPVNMQGAMIIDPAKSPFEINAMIVAEHIIARLSKSSLLRKKLVQDPLKMGDLRMIDDENFDPWNHVTFATLPSPGDQRTLERHMGKFSAQNLNNDIPLWQFEVIEGLEGGKIAVIQKLSHATMDGMAAIKIMQSLFDAEAVEPSKLDEDFDYQLTPEPDTVTLLTDAVKENIERIRVNMPKTVASLSKVAVKSAKKALAKKLADDQSQETREDASFEDKPVVCTTSLNGAISSDKRVMTAANFQLDQFKTLAKAHSCTINDICLTMTSEAMAHYFAGIGEDVSDLYFVMPISTRSAGDKEHGNALALSRVNARNTISDITERLQTIHADTQALKSSRASEKSSGGSKIEDPTAMLSPLLIDAITQILYKANPWELIPPVINAVMTNVPGSRDGLFFAGMPIEYQIPIIPVFHKSALAIGATSMGNTFSFGFHACGQVVKDKNMHLLTDGLHLAYDTLVESAPKTIAVPKATAKASTKPKAATKAKATPKVKTAAKAKVAPKKRTVAKRATKPKA